MFVVFKNPKSERQLESLLSFGRFQAATGFDHENYKAIIMKDCFNKLIFKRIFFKYYLNYFVFDKASLRVYKNS